VPAALLLTALVGCEDEAEQEMAAATEAQSGDEPEQAGPAAPEGPASDPEAAEGDEGDEGRDALDEAMARAKGPSAPPTGEPCEQAYASMKAMMGSLRKQGRGGKQKLPPKEQFMTACAELPERMQRCMGMRYAMNHQEECKKASEEVDPELKARVREIMGAPPPR